MRKYLIGMAMGIFLLCACGSGPSPVAEYIMDLKAQMLRRPQPKDNKPLSYCLTTTCYVYEDQDVRKIKKYIVELESQLKACQGK